MNDYERKYLEKSYDLLKEWIPFEKEQLFHYYKVSESCEYEPCWTVEPADGFHYCMLSWEPFPCAEREIVLVWNEQDEIVADMSVLHCSLEEVLEQDRLMNELKGRDWMELEVFLAAQLADEEDGGEVLLCEGAYVSRRYRRKGIFKRMNRILAESAVRHYDGSVSLLQIYSLDPDFATYGQDAAKTPYYYSFIHDEPVRLRNAEIMRRLGMTPFRLEEEGVSGDDGTKLWFAAGMEQIVIVEDKGGVA